MINIKYHAHYSELMAYNILLDRIKEFIYPWMGMKKISFSFLYYFGIFFFNF